MKLLKKTLPVLFLAFTSCNSDNDQALKQGDTKADIVEQNKSNTKGLVNISDLIALISKDNLNKTLISSYLSSLDENWKYQGSDEKEIFFIKDNNEAAKEMITYKYKQFVIEYLTFSKNHYLNLTKELTDLNFSIVKQVKNDLDGQDYQYSSDKYNLITKEIPLTEPGKTAFKVFIAQKRG